MNSRACVDASLALMWLFPTRGESQADSVLAEWDRGGTELVAPPLFDAEVTSAIWKQVHLKKLLPKQGEEAFSLFRELGVRIVSHPDLQKEAWGLAAKYNMSRPYDAQYLAVAEMEECELWTADKRLFNNLKDKTARIRLVNDDARDNATPVKTSDTRKPDTQDFPGLWQRIR